MLGTIVHSCVVLGARPEGPRGTCVAMQGRRAPSLRDERAMMRALLRAAVCVGAVSGFAPPSSRRAPPSALRASAYDLVRGAEVLDARDGAATTILQGLEGKKALVVLTPQLGDFDSAEYAEHLGAVVNDLEDAGIALRLVGIGEPSAARKFAAFNNITADVIRCDANGAVHGALGLHAGPDWDVPSWAAALLPDDRRAQRAARAWLNYMAMCSGIGSRGTLREILRGYVGDRTAPERLAEDAVVRAGPISIFGTRRVRLGPIEYDQLWKDERGYQRPVELATVRLRVMVEVLSNWTDYVTDDAHLARRGATFLFDADGSVLYEHRDTGVLTYSKTMARPLSFLEPYIGAKARNAFGLRDGD